MKVTIRVGKEQDIPSIYKLIKELAIYERAENEVSVSLSKLVSDFNQGKYKFFVSEVEVNNTLETVGMAFYYDIYSTWKGTSLYLEDIIVTESYRRMGIGKLLFEAVKQEFDLGDYAVFRWVVLHWNEPAIQFYKKFDVIIDPEWVSCRMVKPLS